MSELLQEEGNFFKFFAGNEKAPLRKGGRMPFVRPPLGGGLPFWHFVLSPPMPGESVSQREALKVVLIPQSKPDGRWGYARSGTSGKRQ